MTINKKILQKFDGIVEQANDDELANAAALANKHGLFTCPQTGVALAAFFKLVEKGEIKPQDEVVIVSTAHGLKFTEFKIDYHQSKIVGVDSRYANLPIEIPADIDAVQQKIGEFFGKLC